MASTATIISLAALPDVQAITGLNVADYGAKGDGTANDAAAIQAAHDALPASGGAIVLPVATYKVTSTLTITKPIRLIGAGGVSAHYDPMTIVQDGGGAASVGTKIVWAGAAGADVIDCRNVRGLSIENLIIDGGGLARHCVVWDRIRHSTMRNVVLCGSANNSGGTSDSGQGAAFVIGGRTTADVPGGMQAQNDGSFLNTIEQCSFSGYRALCLAQIDGGRPGAYHNTFRQINLSATGDFAMGLLSGDNNSFTDLRAYRSGATYCIYVSAYVDAVSAYNNYFYHLQCDTGFQAGTGGNDLPANTFTAKVFGFDRANGGTITPESSLAPAPTAQVAIYEI